MANRKFYGYGLAAGIGIGLAFGGFIEYFASLPTGAGIGIGLALGIGIGSALGLYFVEKKN